MKAKPSSNLGLARGAYFAYLDLHYPELSKPRSKNWRKDNRERYNHATKLRMRRMRARRKL